MDNGFIQSLLARITPQSLLGSGAAQQSAQVLQSRPYMLHVQEARALGQQPMTPEQFMQSQQPKGLLGQ